MARIAELNTAFAPAVTPATQSTSTASTSSFANALQSATATAATATPYGVSSGGTVGARIVAAAQGEVGQAEQPPGSNNSPRIAMYRSATQGAIPGAPWCAYFVSWAARQGGVPLGDQGQGFGSVDALWAWAQRTGRAMPASAGPPAPGDLIVWNEHIGIVESVLPDGRIQTIEGNSSDQVSRRIHPAGDAIGYVRLG